VTTSPDAGAPTPGWYLINNGAFGVILDTNGTPVWYSRGNPINVDSPSPGAISLFRSPGGGPFGTSDAGAYSIDDLATSETTTLRTVGSPLVDPFHLNSIDVDSLGNLLISARHANAVFYVSRVTGDVLWKLGGTAYSKDGAALIQVVDDPEGSFNMQHDARVLPNGDISLFDDHGAAAGFARGVEYALDFDSNTATLVFQFLGVGPSSYEGSFRRYADGESVIGWGYVPGDPRVVTEVNASGQDVLDVAFSGGQPSYRAIKVPLDQLDAQTLRSAVGP
jgi:hypothetical protein